MPAPRSVAASLVAALVVVLAGLPGALPADEGGLARRLELPAHEALQAVRTADGATLAPFETDGCSGGMSSSWRLVSGVFPQFEETFRSQPPWEDCCVVHDRAYHRGGALTDPGESYDARLRADEELRACVVETGRRDSAEMAAEYGLTPEQVEAAYATIAQGMYLAVRFGGGPCTGLPWRWGFGWPDCSILSGVTAAEDGSPDAGEKSGTARD